MFDTSQLNEALDRLGQHGSLALDGLLGFCLLWGAFLWLLGTRVVRANFAMQGLIFGAIAAGLVARSQGASPLAAYIFLGGIVGAVVVYLTYRIWIAMALAITLALLTPLGVIAFNSAPPPDLTAQVDRARTAAARGAQDLRDRLPDLGDVTGRAESDEPQDEDTSLADRANAVVRSFVDTIQSWWSNELSSSLRLLVIVGTLAAAATGTLLGLVMPNFAAAVVSSCVGACLLLLGVSVLAQRHVEAVAQILPDSLRGIMATILIATLLGTLIQWTIVRRKADD